MRLLGVPRTVILVEQVENDGHERVYLRGPAKPEPPTGLM
jgi:hypothetical protein